MKRREWLRGVGAGGLALAAGGRLVGPAAAAPPLPAPTAAKLPRWRGFNLLEMFNVQGHRPFLESDFARVAEFGGNFVRLPLDYRCWTDPADWRKLREDVLKRVDEAVRFGGAHGVHVQINFHRAPGYTVARPAEPKTLWKDAEAQEVCALHWGAFARRYQGIPSSRVSFNLFNEPDEIGPDDHKRVVERMLEAIRRHDPDRLVVCDGRSWGTKPPTELVGLGVAAATRGYQPFHLTHYRASWVNGSDQWPKPDYPLREDGKVWDRATLERENVAPWKALEARGVGVMVGEFGAHNRTPHRAVLAWMRDCVAAWKAAGWGYALWNLRGSFGVLDSGRDDVAYESWRGHKLDRAMLEVWQSG